MRRAEQRFQLLDVVGGAARVGHDGRRAQQYLALARAHRRAAPVVVAELGVVGLAGVEAEAALVVGDHLAVHPDLQEAVAVGVQLEPGHEVGPAVERDRVLGVPPRDLAALARAPALAVARLHLEGPAVLRRVEGEGRAQAQAVVAGVQLGSEQRPVGVAERAPVVDVGAEYDPVHLVHLDVGRGPELGALAGRSRRVAVAQLEDERLERWLHRVDGLAEAHRLAVWQHRAVDARFRDLVRWRVGIDDLRRVAFLLGERNVGACPRDDVGGIDGADTGGYISGGGSAAGRAAAAIAAVSAGAAGSKHAREQENTEGERHPLARVDAQVVEVHGAYLLRETSWARPMSASSPEPPGLPSRP